MKLGAIQQSIVDYLTERGGEAFIGVATQSPKHFGGLSFEQVEAALERLVVRRLITSRGHVYKLKEAKQG